jgi:hypothetical protein
MEPPGELRRAGMGVSHDVWCEVPAVNGTLRLNGRSYHSTDCVNRLFLGQGPTTRQGKMCVKNDRGQRRDGWEEGSVPVCKRRPVPRGIIYNFDSNLPLLGSMYNLCRPSLVQSLI